MDDEIFEIENWKNQPEQNVLEKGRYPAEVMSLEKHNSSAGNECNVVVFNVNDVYLKKYFTLKDINKKRHSLAYFWNNFLYAIGIRDKRESFTISEKQILHKKCLVDIAKIPDGEKKDSDGNPIYKNEIRSFSPIEQQTAPIKDVPPEIEVEPEKEESIEDL